MENKENSIDNAKERGFSPENPEDEGARVESAVEDFKREGGEQVEEVEAKGGTEAETGEMRKAAEEADAEAEEAEDAYYQERRAEGEMTEEELEMAQEFVENNGEKLEAVAVNFCEKLGIDIDTIKDAAANVVREAVIEALGNDELRKKLEEEGWIDQKTMAAIVLMTPYIEEALKAGMAGEGEGGGKFAKAMSAAAESGEGDKSAEQRAKEILRVVLDDPEQDKVYLREAGILLVGLSTKIGDKRLALAAKVLGVALQNGTVQDIISKRFRKWLEEDEQPKGQDGDEEVEEEELAAEMGI